VHRASSEVNSWLAGQEKPFICYVMSVSGYQHYGGIILLQNAGTCLLCYMASYPEDCNVIFTALGTSNLTTNSVPFLEPAG
jgi:hypothetical protein